MGCRKLGDIWCDDDCHQYLKTFGCGFWLWVFWMCFLGGVWGVLQRWLSRWPQGSVTLFMCRGQGLRPTPARLEVQHQRPGNF